MARSEKFHARLKLSLCDPSAEQIKPWGTGPHHHYTYRVQVENIGKDDIDDVRVEVSSIKFLDDRSPAQEALPTPGLTLLWDKEGSGEARRQTNITREAPLAYCNLANILTQHRRLTLDVHGDNQTWPLNFDGHINGGQTAIIELLAKCGDDVVSNPLRLRIRYGQHWSGDPNDRPDIDITDETDEDGEAVGYRGPRRRYAHVGLAFLVITFIVTGILVFHPVQPGAEWTVRLFVSFGIGIGAALCGADSRVRGRFPIPHLPGSSVTFAASGGLASFLIVIAALTLARLPPGSQHARTRPDAIEDAASPTAEGANPASVSLAALAAKRHDAQRLNAPDSARSADGGEPRP